MSTNKSLKTTSKLKAVDILQVKSSVSSNPRGLISDQYGANSQGARLFLRKARGVETTPTAVESGDGLGIISFNGYGDTGFGAQVGGSASMEAVAAETWTDMAQGASLVFRTTESGTSSAAVRMVLDHNGGFGLGSNPDPSVDPFYINPYGALTINTLASPAIFVTSVSGQALLANGSNLGPVVQISSNHAAGTGLSLHQANPSGLILSLSDTSGASKIGFKVPALGGDYTLTLPLDAGTPGQFLQTGIGGALSWAAALPIWVIKDDTNDNEILLSTERYIFADTSNAAFTLLLPASPAPGHTVTFLDSTGSFLTNNLSIDPNGENINGGAVTPPLDLDQNYTVMTLIYVDNATGWVFTSGMA